MKKLSIFVLVLVMAVSLAACGRSNNDKNSTPSTDANIMPNIDPSMDTNIPDPSVDTSMPAYTQDNYANDSTGNTGATGGMRNESGRSY